MPRILQCKLPNGKIVSINQFLEGVDTSDGASATEAERLAGLLEGNKTSESELLTFLVNAASSVFHEAEPSERPSIVLGPNELGADLIFSLQQTDGVGIVQIKTAAQTDRAIDHQTRLALSRPILGRPVQFMYVVAGRDHSYNRNAVQTRRQLAGVPVYLLSWDEVIDRITRTTPETTNPGYDIVLVELVNMSRRLLLALASDPRLFSAIDDRRFEELVATLLFDLGLEDVELMPPRKDGGKDIILTHIDRGTGRRAVYLMQCKHWVSGNKVTLHWGLELLDVARREQAAAAVLLSSSGFGPRLLEQRATLEGRGLLLKDAHDLSSWIGIWQRQYGNIILEPVDPRKLLDLRP
jgi:hypothetical protein